MLDKHTLALVNIAGSSLDVLGTLYLAYDLLGGEHGPLRTLTRGVTYGVIFGLGYSLGLGPVAGIALGAAHGITLAWEYARAARQAPTPGFWLDTAMSAIRGCGRSEERSRSVTGSSRASNSRCLSSPLSLLSYRSTAVAALGILPR